MLRTVFDDVIDIVASCLTPESAQRLTEARASTAAQARLDELADKANEGTLTAAETAEYDDCRAALHLICILQAKARGILSGS